MLKVKRTAIPITFYPQTGDLINTANHNRKRNSLKKIHSGYWQIDEN